MGVSFVSRLEVSDISDTRNLVKILGRSGSSQAELSEVEYQTVNVNWGIVYTHGSWNDNLGFTEKHQVGFDFDLSNLLRARRGDKFVPWENNWHQLSYVRMTIPFLSHSHLSQSARCCVLNILIPHPPCSPVLDRYGSGDFVNASMHIFYGRLFQSFSFHRHYARCRYWGMRDGDIFAGILFENT